MRHLTLTTFLVWGLLTGPFVTPARAVSVEELFGLKANGLSDDILVALIESDGSIFQLTPDDVVALFRRGLSEKVILAMIATSRRGPQQPVPTETTASPTPMQQTVIHPFQLVNSSPVEVYSPVAVAVPVSVYAPFYPSRLDNHREILTAPARAYWGFGGELRPGSWQPVVRDLPRDRQSDDGRKPGASDTPPPPTRRR